jgi:uncharacterized membrane protein (DUF2068 family)
MGRSGSEAESPSSTQGRHLATAVCGWRGHVTPAARAASLDGPLFLGVDLNGNGGTAESWRLSRCLRCDAWLAGRRPAPDTAEPLPAPDELVMPRRGRALREAVIERLIAMERGVHCLVFSVIAVLAALLRADLGGVQSWVRRLLSRLTGDTGSGTGSAFNGSIIVKEGNRLLSLKRSELTVLLVIAAAYAVMEGAEAVGLWLERRWAEYLTCLATVGFIPYEVYELMKSTTAVKVGALVLNIVVLVYLVWSKRLFGLGRICPPRDHREEQDPIRVLSRPLAPAPAQPSSR